MLGYNFTNNFNLPYLSKNFSDFWKRWHISLSSWLRDYLYIPLGGNRKGWLLTQRNLILTMLLGGLWHGANWTFVFWGLLHGIYLVVQRISYPVYLFLNRYLTKSLLSLFGIVITFVLVNFAWIFFRSQSISEAFEIISKIISFDDISFASLKPKFQIFKALFVIGILLIGEVTYFFFEKRINIILKKKNSCNYPLAHFLFG